MKKSKKKYKPKPIPITWRGRPVKGLGDIMMIGEIIGMYKAIAN